MSHDIDFARRLHPAMWQVGLGWYAIEFAQTSTILEFYIWFRFRPHYRGQRVVLHQSLKFYPNRTTLGTKNDVMSIFKMVDLSHLEFYGSNNGVFEKPMYDFLYVVNRDHSSKLLSFEKIAFFAFWHQDWTWRISAILDFRGSIMGFLKKPMYDFL